MHLLAHILLGEPVDMWDQVGGRLSPGYALSRTKPPWVP
jgi:hypothetical protein